MNFINTQYIPILLMIIFIFLFVFFRIEKKFYIWVEQNWFFKRSLANKLSSLFFVSSLILFMIALLDLRGPEEHIKGQTAEERTIILIDTSASMLVEDVRPNRFQKAILLVKHYLKQAVGQKIAIVVFSDGQKTIVPFTDDYNLLNARIGTLNELNLSRGGTGLSLAIQESIQYFKDTAEDPKGNILIFTDAEENDGGLDIEVPSNISVAVVGVGTARGGPVPIRDRKGVFRGNKKFKGKEVVSKLNEGFIKSLSDKIKNYEYWIATSYSLPTNEILGFFSKASDIRNSENQFRIKPVYADRLLIPGFIFLIFSMLLRMRKSFIQVALIIIFLFPFSKVTAQEKEEPTKSAETLQMEQAFIEGRLNEEEKKALASKLLQDNFPKQAELLYEELLDDNLNGNNLNHQFNRATAQLKNKNMAKAVKNYKRILDHIKNHPDENSKEIEKITKENLLKALMSQQGQGSGKGEDSDDQKEKQDNKKSDKSDEGKDKQDKKDDKGDDQDDSQKDQKDQKGDKNKNEDKKEESDKEKKERKKKLPALLKQLLSDDNKLQKKMIDAETTKRKKRDKKDW